MAIEASHPNLLLVIQILPLNPGTMSFEAMIKDVRFGLLVDQVLGGGQSNVLAGEFSVNIDLGYLIENGEIVGRVLPARRREQVADIPCTGTRRLGLRESPNPQTRLLFWQDERPKGAGLPFRRAASARSDRRSRRMKRTATPPQPDFFGTAAGHGAAQHSDALVLVPRVGAGGRRRRDRLQQFRQFPISSAATAAARF